MLLRVQIQSFGFTLVLLRVNIKSTGFTLVLLRVQGQTMFLQWLRLGPKEQNDGLTLVLLRVQRTNDPVYIGFVQG